jgi:hypothetical protein
LPEVANSRQTHAVVQAEDEPMIEVRQNVRRVFYDVCLLKMRRLAFKCEWVIEKVRVCVNVIELVTT